MVSDERVMQLLDERLRQQDCQDGFILDGFLRNRSQARLLGELLDGSGQQLDAVLLLEVNHGVLMKPLICRPAVLH